MVVKPGKAVFAIFVQRSRLGRWQGARLYGPTSGVRAFMTSRLISSSFFASALSYKSCPAVFLSSSFQEMLVPRDKFVRSHRLQLGSTFNDQASLLTNSRRVGREE